MPCLPVARDRYPFFVFYLIFFALVSAPLLFTFQASAADLYVLGGGGGGGGCQGILGGNIGGGGGGGGGGGYTGAVNPNGNGGSGNSYHAEEQP